MFQSSPALSSGRYHNPMLIVYHAMVSILARSFERALPRRGLDDGSHFQVSILARSFERALPCDGRGDVQALSVSILARSFERALLEQLEEYTYRQMFQSSPALSSGRYMSLALQYDVPLSFQSSPALSSGRYLTAESRSVRSQGVSILARSFERALPRIRCGLGGRIGGFNPRPLFRAGATSTATTATARRPGFNPRPLFRAGATPEQSQSDWPGSSFNPRPLFRAGATALPHQSLKTWGLALVFANMLLTH